MSKIMAVTYLLRPDKDVANQRDRLTSGFIGRFLTKAGVDFEVLPWRIPAVSGMQDEQHYSINSQDLNLERRLSAGNFIVVNTSGYAHGRTYFFEKPLKMERVHFALDSHADLWNTSPQTVGSDGFNAEILNLEGVRYCALMGVVPNENLVPRFQNNGEIEKVLNRLNIYMMDKIENLKTCTLPWAADVHEKIMKTFPQMKEYEFFGIPQDISLAGKPIYVSVDLDAIQDFPSDWTGHGRLRAKDLSRMITRLGRRYRVVAGDICGVDSKHLTGEALDNFWAVYQSLRCAINPAHRDVTILNGLGED